MNKPQLWKRVLSARAVIAVFIIVAMVIAALTACQPDPSETQTGTGQDMRQETQQEKRAGQGSLPKPRRFRRIGRRAMSRPQTAHLRDGNGRTTSWRPTGKTARTQRLPSRARRLTSTAAAQLRRKAPSRLPEREPMY